MPSFLQMLMGQLAGAQNPQVPQGPAYGPTPGTLGGPGGELYGQVPIDDVTRGAMAANYLSAQNRGLGPMGTGPWDQGIGLGGYGLQFNPTATLDPSQVQMNPYAGWYRDLPPRYSGLQGPMPSPYALYDPIQQSAGGPYITYPWGPVWDQLLQRSPP